MPIMTAEVIRKEYDEINRLVASGNVEKFDAAIQRESALFLDLLTEIALRDDCGSAKALAAEVLTGRDQVFTIAKNLYISE